MRPFGSAIIVGGTILSTLGCGGAVVASNDGTVVTGAWNGANLSLTLDERGGATEYDCAHGGLSAPVIVDATGAFRVTGVHVPEHGGPIRLDEIPDSLPAIYVGRWTGDAITMRVLVGVDTLGPFTLRRDAPSRLLKCL